MTTPEALPQRPFDGRRLVVATAVTAGLGVAVAAAFLHFYPRGNDLGATAAALRDAFAWILGASLGLAIGSCATALLVRAGSRFFAGFLAGVAGFWTGVTPYMVATTPSDVSSAAALGFAFIAFAPALVFATVGSALGVALRRVLQRRTA
ncbi:MAG TPA: hypothetical protein VJ838_06805 [Gaiellaceae bacterium]|nr:hypothetical protein [Gaiellaceae bacterium]